MRWQASLLALGLAACGFDTGGLPPGHVIRDDTAADFMATGSSLDGAEISSAGLISPVAYTTGALVAKGNNNELFTDPHTVDWGTLDAATPARVALSVPLGDYGNGAPVGVGIVNNDNYTFWLEGEIWLEAGGHDFELTADDNGLLDLAPAAGAAFTRVVAAQWFDGAKTGTFTAPADGWYPIRIAMSEGNGMAFYKLRHRPPSATGLAPLDPDRLRVAVGARRGIVADTFDDFYLIKPAARTLFSTSLLEQDFGTTAPPDSGITAATAYSLHWAAQLRIDVGGDYAFLLDTDDGHRLRIDGQLVADHFVNVAQTSTTDPIHLDPGWHDVVIDYTQFAASAHARLHVASGPDLVNGPFPLDRVRPVVPRTDRVAGASDPTMLTFAQNGTVTHMLAPPIPAGATVVGVDVSYVISTQHLRDVQITLVAPDGTRAIVRPQNDVDRGGTTGEKRTTHLLDGKAASGPWQLEVAEKAGMSNGSSRDASITVHYAGGRPPIATASSYESAIKDLGAPSHIDEVTYAAAAPQGSAVVVRLRTGATPDELMAQPWSDPVASGAPPIVASGQLVQYRVELASDGDHSPTFDSIQIVYRATQ